ncbi:hypothetical protein SAMD00023353_3500760 [Rosellinia necatrix]|uniref:Uncharacterized protein n=1 Tax=Rosellinia necatrix TaxID=77044 RepID=A0A1S8A8V7_ROSNE|nr:hypothetical protein SAMD00023353_3500760 [Rosellinia necatrix]
MVFKDVVGMGREVETGGGEINGNLVEKVSAVLSGHVCEKAPVNEETWETERNSPGLCYDGSITKTGQNVVLFAKMFQFPGSEGALRIIP